MEENLRKKRKKEEKNKKGEEKRKRDEQIYEKKKKHFNITKSTLTESGEEIYLFPYISEQ